MTTVLISVITALSAALTASIIGLYQKINTEICKSKKRLDGKTAVVTGGTSGIGLEIALDFAQRGAKVIIACPYKKEGINAQEHIIKNSGNENVVFKPLDLASLVSVRKFANDILNSEERLDILMNNAGVGIPADFQTSDGLNFIMQVNYFGHFLLTLLLLPLLKKTAKTSEPSRIVNTSSILHQIGRLDVENWNKTSYWYRIQLYGNSKLCLLLFSHELTKRLVGSNVVINSVEPGFLVGTRIFYSASTIAGLFGTYVMPYIFNTPWEGAQTALHAALDERAGQVSGQFFSRCKQVQAAKVAYNDESSKLLWDESVKLVGLGKDELCSVLNN